LVIQRSKKSVENDYPGSVFADEDLEYTEAMTKFISASADKSKSKEIKRKQENHSDDKQLLRADQEALRAKRRQQRHHRKNEDAHWQELLACRKKEQQEWKALTEANQRPPWGSKKAANQKWKGLRQRRREQMQQRKQQDNEWRQQREKLRLRASKLKFIPIWIAILVIVDNCTRKSFGLPTFLAGVNVTAEMVVDALRQLLPVELQFLISDRGAQFRAKLMKQLEQELDFIHVVIARHRPQSNGISERFIRTMKEWLVEHSWNSDQKLTLLLNQFNSEYNERPHQGINGLSPSELTKRMKEAKTKSF
jgi:transposase InsO family protein